MVERAIVKLTTGKIVECAREHLDVTTDQLVTKTELDELNRLLDGLSLAGVPEWLRCAR